MTSLYASFAKNCMLPAIDFAYGSFVRKQLQAIECSQWWTTEKLQKYQSSRIKSLISHACRTVPFYRRYFKENKLKPSNFSQIADLAKLPIISKELISRNPSDFISSKYEKNKLIQISTGGTTGRPLKSYTTEFSRSFLRTTGIRGWRWAGYDYGDKSVTLAGTSLVPNESISLTKKLRSLVERNLSLSAAHLNESILYKYVEQIIKYKPKVIRGYPSSIYVLARFIRDHYIEGVRPEIVITTAEVLLEKHRNLIENVFDCKVYNNYSNPESLANAYECKYGKLHLGTDVSFIEIIDNKNGSGNIIATDLTNYGMPMIRYDTEDMARFSEELCECGRVLPVINSLEGRSTDIISFSNGNSLGGPALTLIFQNFNLDNYQVVQDKEDSIAVKIVKSRKFQENEIDEITKIMRYHCGEGVEIKVKVLSEIKSGKSGKWRFIKSKVNSNT